MRPLNTRGCARNPILLAREGDYVDVPDPPSTTCQEWVDFMVPWWEEGTNPDIGEVWDSRRPTMSNEECRRHVVTYHQEVPQHGEAIGVTIRAWSLWVNTPEEAALREALSYHIETARVKGIDH